MTKKQAAAKRQLEATRRWHPINKSSQLASESAYSKENLAYARQKIESMLDRLKRQQAELIQVLMEIITLRSNQGDSTHQDKFKEKEVKLREDIITGKKYLLKWGGLAPQGRKEELKDEALLLLLQEFMNQGLDRKAVYWAALEQAAAMQPCENPLKAKRQEKSKSKLDSRPLGSGLFSLEGPSCRELSPQPDSEENVSLTSNSPPLSPHNSPPKCNRKKTTPVSAASQKMKSAR